MSLCCTGSITRIWSGWRCCWSVTVAAPRTWCRTCSPHLRPQPGSAAGQHPGLCPHGGGERLPQRAAAACARAPGRDHPHRAVARHTGFRRANRPPRRGPAAGAGRAGGAAEPPPRGAGVAVLPEPASGRGGGHARHQPGVGEIRHRTGARGAGAPAWRGTMNTVLDRLTDAMNAAAGTVRDEELRPLTMPERRRRLSPWAAPVAAAAAMVLVIGLAVSVSNGLFGAGRSGGTAHLPVVPHRYYLATDLGTWKTAVRSTATGNVIAVVPVPSLAVAGSVSPALASAGNGTFY